MKRPTITFMLLLKGAELMQRGSYVLMIRSTGKVTTCNTQHMTLKHPSLQSCS